MSTLPVSWEMSVEEAMFNNWGKKYRNACTFADFLLLNDMINAVAMFGVLKSMGRMLEVRS